MQQSNDRYEYLAEKWMNGTITPQEKEEFARWYNAPLEDPLEVPASLASGETEQRNRILRRILPRVRRRRRVVAAAACVLITVIAGFAVSKYAPGRPAQAVTVTGFNRTMLTLADGKQLAVESLSIGGTMEEQGMIITKGDSSFLSYSGKAKSANAAAFNTLTTTRGGNFRVQLSDGSRIWLNSASTLRYPTSFPGATREVFLSGQAYFEVATNSHQPFIVHAGGETVRVMGTAFDLKAYIDEDETRTTLIRGAIAVSAGSSSRILHRGEQVRYRHRDSTLLRTDPDMEEVLAWKEGRFQFSNTNIRGVMRQLSRWYHVTVDYRGDLTGVNLTGSISCKKNVAELLRALEATGGVRLVLADTTIIVQPK